MRPILVADDERDMVQLVRFNIEKAGYKVETACNGHEAIQKARTLRPSALVLDVLMPGIDGFEVCKILQFDSRTRAIPILLLTALNTTIAKMVGIESGAADFMTKPFRPAELVDRVRAMVATRPGEFL